MRSLFVVIGALATCAPMAVSAQQLGPRTSIISDDFRDRLDQRGRNESVRQRGRPEYDPSGINLGGFTAFPVLEFEPFSTDNLVRSSSNEIDALGLNLRAGGSLRSNWSVHALALTGSVGQFTNDQESSENATTYDLQAAGRLDVSRGRNLQGLLRFAHGVEARGSSGTASDAVEPIEYDLFNVGAGVSWEFSRLRLAARLDSQGFDYLNGTNASGGVVDQSDRDRVQTSLVGRVEYAQSPALAWYGEVSANERAYDVSNAGSRDSTGVSIIVGSNFDISGLTRGEIGIGYISQDYDSTLYNDLSGLGVRAAVEWFPSRLLTIGASASRTIDDSSVPGSGGITSTGFGVQADYELRRNIILTGRAQFVNADYSGVDRSDDTTDLSLSVAYLLNRVAALSVFVNSSALDSSGVNKGPSYDEIRLGSRLTLRR